MDRKRISLSLKSDAASRLTGEKGSSSAGTSTGGTGKKRIVVVKKGSGANGAAGAKPADRKPRERQNYGSDDGYSYNPFAALLKK